MNALRLSPAAVVASYELHIAHYPSIEIERVE